MSGTTDPTLAMYTVGQMAEIMEVILSFASRSSLYNCTLVCKSYHDIAIKYLWRRLPSAWPLLRLLGSIELLEFADGFVPTYGQEPWVIARRTPSWSRGTMDYYNAQHVSAKGEEDDGEGDESGDCCYSRCRMHRDTLQQIVQHQYSASGGALRAPLVPNLEHLEFTFSRCLAPPGAFTPLLGPKIKSLSLLYHLCPRMFDDFDGPKRLIQQGLQELAEFEGEIHLKRLEISLQYLTGLLGPHQDINNAFVLVLERHTQLCHVKSPPFSRHNVLVSGLRHLNNLRSLSVAFETAGQLMAFVTAFAPEHPNIRVLDLAHRSNDTTPQSILDPLFHCRSLINLSITTYGRSRNMRISWWSLPDVHKMSEAWPELQALTLHPRGTFALKDLGMFQSPNLFPRLKKLLLPIHCVGATIPSLQVQLRLRSLPSLQTFTIEDCGEINADDIPALIKYAARIGTKKTRIEPGGHAVGCACKLCCRMLECQRKELRPFVSSSKAVRAYMASTA
ncbi:hypothetical protein FRC05_003533 [Tulasnella sp. 425]|nr:hypothetical protein FRC05_003533 [Tulasnella sp. 425]